MKSRPCFWSQKSDRPGLSYTYLSTMPRHSTSNPMPTRIAMTLKNIRALRAAATSSTGRTCSDIRCLSCFTSSCFTSLCFTSLCLIVIADHPPPHVAGEQREHPPLQGVSRVAPREAAADQCRWRHPFDRGGRDRCQVRRLGGGEDKRVVQGARPAVDKQ